MTFGNVMVGQSGGPTAVINSSLAGVYKTAIDCGCKKVYGMVNGIEGLSQNKYIYMSSFKNGVCVYTRKGRVWKIPSDMVLIK